MKDVIAVILGAIFIMFFFEPEVLGGMWHDFYTAAQGGKE